jgi:hypothetical protein
LGSPSCGWRSAPPSFEARAVEPLTGQRPNEGSALYSLGGDPNPSALPPRWRRYASALIVDEIAIVDVIDT